MLKNAFLAQASSEFTLHIGQNFKQFDDICKILTHSNENASTKYILEIRRKAVNKMDSTQKWGQTCSAILFVF